MKLAQKLSQVGSNIKALRESLGAYSAGDESRPEGKLIRFKEGSMSREAMVVAKLIADVQKGRVPDYLLKEAMTTSDFPLLMGDVLNRTMLGNYIPWPVTYPGYFREVTVKDFRTLHMYTLDGGQGILTPIAEREPYPEITFVEGTKTLAVVKYGRRYDITFEMLVNDDLNAFNQRPLLMAEGARRSEEYLATTMMCDTNGPHATMYSSGNANIVTSNPILSIQGLQAAMVKMAAQRDADNQPIMITSYALVVPPALEIAAQNIMHALQIRVNDNTSGPGGGSAGQMIYAQNWMTGKVQLYVNPYIPYVATSNGNTSWFLIANPNDVGQRPAFAFGKLRGYELPQLFMKSANSTQLGGGVSNAVDGDFEQDAIAFKLRHFIGASQIDPKMTVASNGTGS